MKGNNRFYFKACPRCRGDMYLDEDVYGAYTKCLQCGRIYEIPAIKANETKVKKVEKVGAHERAAELIPRSNNRNRSAASPAALRFYDV